MSIVSFDRATAFYDKTRGMPPVASDEMASIAIDLIGSHQRVVEIGVGTGRIAKPLIAKGMRVIGIDISREMMALVRQDTPTAALIQGDVMRLPLMSGSADAVIAVHILHLVSDRELVLAEAQRMLRPGGVFLLGRNRRLPSVIQELRDHLNAFFGERGVGVPQAGRVALEEELEEVLCAAGARVDIRETQPWTTSITVTEDIRGIEQRLWSHLWSVPDDALADGVTELRRYAMERFGSLDVVVDAQQTFEWKAFRWS